MRPQEYPFRWPQFLICFTMAPVVVTVLTFWLIIPVGALIVGGPFYLLAGLPMAALYLQRFAPDYLPMILLGQACQLLQIPAAFAFPSLMGGGGMVDDLPVLLFFGAFFALVWTVVFVWFYRAALRDDAAAQEHPNQQRTPR